MNGQKNVFNSQAFILNQQIKLDGPDPMTLGAIEDPGKTSPRFNNPSQPDSPTFPLTDKKQQKITPITAYKLDRKPSIKIQTENKPPPNLIENRVLTA